MSERRWWWYSTDTWEPRFRWSVSRGGDEWGRRTVVLPVPFKGFLVIAWRTCRCSDCDEMRAFTRAGDEAYELHLATCCDDDDHYVYDWVPPVRKANDGEGNE